MLFDALPLARVQRSFQVGGQGVEVRAAFGVRHASGLTLI
jgi:hypothetical protein